jgi:hypothetical protein
VLTDGSTGVSTQGSTNESGIYRIPGLQLGTYTLAISSPSFRSYQHSGIVLIAAQVLQINVQMEIGSSAQNVTVTGDAPLLESETSTVATTMEESAIEDLPLSAAGGQDAFGLLMSTTPGVRGTRDSNNDYVSISGIESVTNSVYLNGVEATGGLQGHLATPGKDALQEIQIMTSAADAEFQDSSVELFQIKSGTSQLHGKGFEILQNEDLNANSYESNYFLSSCAPGDSSCKSQYSRPVDRFNDWGFSAGGPIPFLRNL